MSESAISLEQILLDSISGDNEKIQGALSLYQELEEDFLSMIENLFDLVMNTTNAHVRSISLINIAGLISRNIKTLSKEKINEISQKLVKIYQLIEGNDLHYYASIILSMTSIDIQNDDGILITFFKQLNEETPNSQKLHELTLEIVGSYRENPNPAYLAQFYESYRSILMYGFQHENLYYHALSIKVIATMIDFFPDQVENFEDFFAYILEDAKRTLSCSEKDYIDIWLSIGILFSSFEAGPDLIQPYIPIVFEAGRKLDIRPEMRQYAYLALETCISELDTDNIHKIMFDSLQNSVDFVEQVHELPTNLFRMYEVYFRCFEHQKVYTILKNMILELREGNIFSKEIVAFSLVKLIVDKVPNQVYTEIDLVIENVDYCLEQEDLLFKQIGCQIITTFGSYFAWNLIDVEHFIPSVIPLLVHAHPDVRQAAYDATHRIIDITLVPLPLLVKRMLVIVNQVNSYDILPYLLLLSKAILAELTFSRDDAFVISNFSISLMEKDDFETVYGAINIAQSIISVHECVYETLIGPLLISIEKCLQNEERIVHFFGISTLYPLFKIAPEQARELFEKYQDNITSVFDLDDVKCAWIKQQANMKIASIVAVCPEVDPLIISKLCEIGSQWLESNDHPFIAAGIKILKKVARALPADDAIMIYKAIANICVRTTSMPIACKAIKANLHMLKHSTGDVKVEMLKIGYQMSEHYINGDLAVMEGVPPMTTDIDFKFMYVYGRETAELFALQNPISHMIVNFAANVWQRGNSLKNELIMNVWASALQHNVLNEEEIAYIKNITLTQLLIEEVPSELLLYGSQLIGALLEQDYIEWEVIEQKIPIIVSWYERCKNKKHKMRSTLTNIVALIWKISFHFKARNKFSDLVMQTLKDFPPDDITRTVDMCKLILRSYHSQEFPITKEFTPLLCLRVARLLDTPSLVLKKKGVPDSMIQDFIDHLHKYRKQQPEVQAALNKFILKTEERKERLQQFLE